ncbi:KGK domain-containing protein [Spirulina major]|uniref:KGK domain-containing protein n=1 Tax=Spirulina major TaxID=270636 RepID=UPI0009351288|nr:KGK domain-containing protein [Spirulina major]
MNSDFQELSSDNAIINIGGSTFKAVDLRPHIDIVLQQSYEKINEQLASARLGKLHHSRVLSAGGFNGEILEIKTGEWIKGKVRIRSVFEFCPDEVIENTEKNESTDDSLDEIRRSL